MAIGFRSKASAQSGANSIITLDVAKPAGVVAGDCLVARLAMPNAQTTINGPSGFTLLDASVNSAATPPTNLVQWVKVAGSSEPGSYNFNWGATGGGIASVTAYTGVDTTTPVVSTEHGAVAVSAPSTQTRSTPSITVGANRWLLSAFVDSAGSTWSGLDAGDTVRQSLIRAGGITLVEADTNAPVTAGSYSRSGTVSATYAQGAQAILALNPAPAPALSATAVVSPTTVIPPSSITLTITASGGTGSYTYAVTNWGDGTSSASQSSNVFTKSIAGGATAGTKSITWTVTG